MTPFSIRTLIERHLNGQSTPEEVEQLNAYFRQHGLIETQLPEGIEHQPSKDQSTRMYQQLTGMLPFTTTINIRYLLRVAAAVLILVFGTYWLINKQAHQPAITTITNTTTGVKLVTLADGTNIYLNRKASITLNNERAVSLFGEAYFEVAHDTAHPFRVSSGNLTTTVLGTSFTVNKTTVSLFTGKVALSASNTTTQYLKPGQAATYDSASRTIQQHPLSIYALAWKTRSIRCSKEKLEDIIHYLSQLYETPIHIDQRITGKYFSGVLSLQGSLTDVLQRLLFVHRLQYKQEGRSYSIY